MAASVARGLTAEQGESAPYEVNALYLNDYSNEVPMNFLVVATTNQEHPEGEIFAASTPHDYTFEQPGFDVLHATQGAKIYKLRIRRLTDAELDALELEEDIGTYEFLLLSPPEVIGTVTTAEALRLMREAGWPHSLSSD